MKKNVLVVGIGGASLGTEVLKSLSLSRKYNIFGSDISPFAFGLYEDKFTKTFLINKNKYVDDLLGICQRENINIIIPGGEKPLIILNQNREIFQKKGIFLAINSAEVIELCVDKIKTFDYLYKKGIPVPFTKIVNNRINLKNIPYPCVIKPSKDSGGSVFVYIAENYEEANFCISFLKKRNIVPVIQEYIPDTDGEYTVGVLSLPNGELIGSIALKRLFHSKLSVLIKTEKRVISSGYSQGIIDNFYEIRLQAEKIAKTLNSKGPLNIQGRVKNGIFYPFEVNPRFSASTYLRTLAGFNEIDIFINFLSNEKIILPKKIKYGYYFRNLDEKFINFKKIKNGNLDY